MASIRGGTHSIIGLLVAVRLIDRLLSIATVQGGIGMISWAKATAAVVLTVGVSVSIHVAVCTAVIHAMAIPIVAPASAVVCVSMRRLIP